MGIHNDMSFYLLYVHKCSPHHFWKGVINFLPNNTWMSSLTPWEKLSKNKNLMDNESDELCSCKIFVMKVEEIGKKS